MEVFLPEYERLSNRILNFKSVLARAKTTVTLNELLLNLDHELIEYEGVAIRHSLVCCADMISKLRVHNTKIRNEVGLRHIDH